MTTRTERQPPQVYALALCEFWERFGFYSLQAVAILYLTNGLHISDHVSEQIYAVFNALLYMMTLAGGFVADRYLGHKHSMIAGNLFFLVGYSLLTLSPHYFFWGLCFIILGNGFFKPNVSTMVGESYPTSKDIRRESGFTIFYMIINVGSLLPPLFIGAVVNQYGWSNAFLFSCVGMLVCALTIFLSRKLIKKIGNTPLHSPLLTSKKTMTWLVLVILAIGCLALVHEALSYPVFSNMILSYSIILIAAFMIYLILKQKKQDRPALLACCILILISILFWAYWVQIYSSITLLAQRNIRHHLFGIHFYPETIQFFEPFFIIALSPLLSRWWIKLQKKHKNPSIPSKFSWAIAAVAVAFLSLYLALRYAAQNGIIAAEWGILFSLLLTIGELLLSPIGLAMITMLSPKHLSGLMMGMWFVALSFGFSLGGHIANLSNVPRGASAVQSALIYQHAYGIDAMVCLLMALLSAALIPWINKLMLTKVPLST